MSSHRDDTCWDAALERLDTDVVDLAAAEERLNRAEDQFVSREEVEALVAKATEPGPYGVTPVKAGRIMRLSRSVRVAGVLLAVVLLAVGGVFLLWPGGAISAETMTYSVAIQLLELPHQPAEHRLSAVAFIAINADLGIRTLKAIRNDAGSETNLLETAGSQLFYLQELLEGKTAGSPGAVDDSMGSAARIARDPNNPIEQRLAQMKHLALLTEKGIVALQRMASAPPEVVELRDTRVAKLLKRLKS